MTALAKVILNSFCMNESNKIKSQRKAAEYVEKINK